MIGSGQVRDLLGGNKMLPPPRVSQHDGSIRVVLTQLQWAEVFLEEVKCQGGRTFLSQRPCVCDQGEPYSTRGFRLW